jgi:hypothetical protein
MTDAKLVPSGAGPLILPGMARTLLAPQPIFVLDSFAESGSNRHAQRSDIWNCNGVAVQHSARKGAKGESHDVDQAEGP